MNRYEELYSMLIEKSFAENRGDDRQNLIEVHDAVTAILERYELLPKTDELYEYGYMQARGLNKTIVTIGAAGDFESYKENVLQARNTPVRKYYRRPKDTRTWEEIIGPDSELFD